MKRLSLVISFCITFLFCGCFFDSNVHYSIVVTNNSDNDIYVDGWDSPDELYVGFSLLYHNQQSYRVPAHSTCETAKLDGRASWEGLLNSSEWDTLAFFFFNANYIDSLEQNGFDYYDNYYQTIQDLNDYAVLRRDCFSLHDLDSLNWTLTYP